MEERSFRFHQKTMPPFGFENACVRPHDRMPRRPASAINARSMALFGRCRPQPARMRACFRFVCVRFLFELVSPDDVVAWRNGSLLWELCSSSFGARHPPLLPICSVAKAGAQRLREWSWIRNIAFESPDLCVWFARAGSMISTLASAIFAGVASDGAASKLLSVGWQSSCWRSDLWFWPGDGKIRLIAATGEVP